MYFLYAVYCVILLSKLHLNMKLYIFYTIFSHENIHSDLFDKNYVRNGLYFVSHIYSCVFLYVQLIVYNCSFSKS